MFSTRARLETNAMGLPGNGETELNDEDVDEDLLDEKLVMLA